MTVGDRAEHLDVMHGVRLRASARSKVGATKDDFVGSMPSSAGASRLPQMSDASAASWPMP